MSTIVALSTPAGRSAVALIRLSGPRSLHIAAQLTQDQPDSFLPRRTILRTFYDSKTGEVLDQAVVTYMPGPKSFTGEDVIEISCHGSPVVVRRLIDLFLEKGARLAEAGEFTMRALASGKLDLSQAEAIRDLIDAQTDAAARQAMRQLSGELALALQPTKESLLEVIVTLESALEFVEDDLPAVQIFEIEKQLKNISAELSKLAATYNAGHWLRDGVKVTIAGRPNVGKSSLFNSLLKRDRSIVTSIPGTTRDTITETINMGGVPVSLTDTAGIRTVADEVERIGIDRANSAIAEADLVLFVIDGSEEVTDLERQPFSPAGDSRYLVVFNKCDLPAFGTHKTSRLLNEAETVNVSALLGYGLDELCHKILDRVGVRNSQDEGLLLTDARHHDLLKRSAGEIEIAIGLMRDHASEELVLVGLHNALKLLGAVTGETTSEDILSSIFATFCIGK
jgi:tRNA modification GTPase